MSETEPTKVQESLQEILQQVIELLSKHQLVEGLVHKQDMTRHDLVETLVHKQHLIELQKKLDQLHSADIAYIIEALPLEQRQLVWDMVNVERDGDILLEVSDAVRESLIASMDSGELLAAAEQLDTDEIADLAPDLPHDVMQELLESLDSQNRAHLQSAMSYPEDTVGSLMDFDMISIRDDIGLEVVLRYLRRLGELPGHTDKLFVVDRKDHFRGVLSLKRLLVHDPEASVAAVMAEDAVTFHPDDEAGEAASAFERYDLVSAPVVDRNNKLVGRLTVDVMMDFIREESDSEKLSMVGLREEEDLFTTVWKAAKNRWLWLAINLCTALVASRVVGAFEGSIEKLAALAALMPIVAGMGGNSGNQTSTLVVRGFALGLINKDNARRILTKELGIALLNGTVWGSVMGVVTYLLYHNAALGGVMAAAMLLNLLVAAVAGYLAPAMIDRLGRDPAYGSAVLTTFITDSMGFFIFLGLATVVLL